MSGDATARGGAEGPSLEERVGDFLRRALEEDVEVTSLRRLSGGASQETYRVEVRPAGSPPDAPSRPLALRRAAGGREDDGSREHPGLRTEALLFRVARAHGIPEPEILGVLEPGDGLGAGFVMEWLDGETLGPRIVRSDRFAAVRPRLARQCGEILARIHAVDVGETGLADRLRVRDTAGFVRDIRDNYRRLDSPQPMIDYAALWLLEHLPAEGTPRLVHNDFRNGNLMVSAEEGVVAVLDWEIAHLGDPMRDLGWICCNSWRFGGELPVGGFGTREDLFAGYEAVSGEAVDSERVRWWEVFGSFWWAVGTLGMAHQYRVGPDRTVERPAIGRRTSECQMDCVNLLFPGPFEVEAPEPEAADLAHRVDLLRSVRDFLRGDVMGETSGRTAFLARVAANSLDVVLREEALGGAHLRRESQGLSALGCCPPEGTTDEPADVEAGVRHQRRHLIERMETGDLALDDPALRDHLRATVAQQLAVDQPGYSALSGSTRPDSSRHRT